MKFNKFFRSQRWFDYTLALCIAVLFYLAVSHINLLFRGIDAMMGFARPIFLGLIMAYILDPLVSVFERYVFRGVKKESLKRNLSVIAALVAVIVGIVFLMIALIPQLIDSVKTFFGNINTYADGVMKLLTMMEEKTAGGNIDMSGIIKSGEEALNKMLGKLPSNMTTILNTTVSVSQSVFSWVIGFILAIYFLMDKIRLRKWIGRLYRLSVTEKTYANSANFWNRCNSILIRYIVFDLLDGLIIGIANAIFMVIAGMPYNALISVLIGLTNLAPTFGPIIGGAIGALILVLVKPWYALWFLIFTIILQTVDGYILKPKLFGSSLGVSGVWILICIVIGGRMFGVGGILLAIPFAAISDFIFEEVVIANLDARKKRREAEAEAAAELEEAANVERKAAEMAEAAAEAAVSAAEEVKEAVKENAKENDYTEFPSEGAD